MTSASIVIVIVLHICHVSFLYYLNIERYVPQDAEVPGWYVYKQKYQVNKKLLENLYFNEKILFFVHVIFISQELAMYKVS